MGTYQVVSLDLFQTLVDVNKRIPQIWRGILGSKYSEELAAVGAEAVLSCFPSAYGQAVTSGFLGMEEVYSLCAGDAVKKTGIQADAGDIAYHLMLQHGYAPFYEDVPQALKRIKELYKVIICSDSNHLMVDPLLQMLDYDAAFISEDIGFYKGDSAGNFFKQVLSELKISPDKIIHVGDSLADIIGAKKAGIASCLVNREHRIWKYSVQPDYTIAGFDELLELLA
jgi:HAD superfamily hydrolase (TIGR01509 family)